MKASPEIIVVIFSLLGVGILYGISLTSVVPYVPLEEVAVGTHDGAFIRTKGLLIDFRATEYGNLLTITRNKTELLIFVDSTNARNGLLNLNYGDEIEVQGRVQLYKGRYELVVTESALKLKKACNENKSAVSFVSQIARHPGEYEGRRISVMGYAEDVYKHVFYLCDDEGGNRMRMRVKAKTGIPISELQKGDKIIAEGVFSYNPENMGYELNLISLRRC